MTAYLINPAEEGQVRTVAFKYSDRAAAQMAMTSNQYLVETEADVIWTGQTLVDFFNAVSNSSLKKFESRMVGVRRLLAVLPQVAQEPKQELTKMETQTNVAEGDKEKKVRGRASKFKPEMVITVLVEANPKRADTASHKRFSYYENGMTIKAFIDAGGELADIANDTSKKYISVV